MSTPASSNTERPVNAELVEKIIELLPNKLETTSRLGGAAITKSKCVISSCNKIFMASSTAGGMCDNCRKEYINSSLNVFRSEIISLLPAIIETVKQHIQPHHGNEGHVCTVGCPNYSSKHSIDVNGNCSCGNC